MYFDTIHSALDRTPIPILFNGDRAIFFESIPDCFVTQEHLDQRKHLMMPGAREGSIEVAL